MAMIYTPPKISLVNHPELNKSAGAVFERDGFQQNLKRLNNVNVTPPCRSKSVFNTMKKTLFKIIRADDDLSFKRNEYAKKNSKIIQLRGMTIKPDIAKRFIKKVNFDHTGKIIDIIPGKIKLSELKKLERNITEPLNEKVQAGEDSIRTPGEVIVNIAGLTQHAGLDLASKNELYNLLKFTWLEGSPTHQVLCDTIALIKERVKGNYAVSQEIDNIMNSLEKDFFLTKRNDNFYGRLFETELSKYICENPSYNMLKVRDIVSSFIIDDFLKISEESQYFLCEVIAKRMRDDPPIWRDNLICANDFLLKKDPESFIEMMKYLGDYSVPLILAVAVKYIAVAENMKNLREESHIYYAEVIYRQRNLVNLQDNWGLVRNKIPGLLLPYQHKLLSTGKKSDATGIRPIDRYKIPAAGDKLTEHDSAALTYERAVGIGMSGSSNLLKLLFRELESQHSDFPVEDAKLATASWVSYSGGHSFNEAYSVFDSKRSNFEPLSFNKLEKTSRYCQNAISHAFDKVVAASAKLRR